MRRHFAVYTKKKATPVFVDKFGVKEMEKLTLYTISPSPSSLSPSVKLLGWHADRALKAICRVGENIAKDKTTAAPISIAGVKGIACFFPASTGFYAQDSLQIFSENVDGLSSALGRLGSNFRSVSEDELIKRMFNSSSLQISAFPEVSRLIGLPSETDRRLKIRETGVGLSSLYQTWKEELQFCNGLLSGDLFGDARSIVSNLVSSRLAVLRDSWKQHIMDTRRPEELTRGCQITVFGPPNTGKSSFLNMLLRKNIATVSPIAGSTTDVLDSRLAIDGLPVLLTDTVGLSKSVKPPQLQSTFSRVDSSDLKICILDMSQVYNNKKTGGIDPEVLKTIDSDTLVLINKRDLVNIRIPAPPAQIRFKQTPLSPQGDVPRHAKRGRIPLRCDGNTEGNDVLHGDYGLRVLEDVRLTEACLQECRTTLHRNIKTVRGARFWLRVKPDHPMTKKAIGTRMGKGKAPFDHWEAKVPNKKIIFEIGGGVSEEMARGVLKSVGSRISGKTEFVVAPKEEMVDQMCARVAEYSKIPPMGVWAVSCTTGEGMAKFLDDLKEILKTKYGSDQMAHEASSKRLNVLTSALGSLDHVISSADIQRVPEDISTSLEAIVDKSAVDEAVKYLFHSQFGVLKEKMDQRRSK